MVAVDTNLLVYCIKTPTPIEIALRQLRALAALPRVHWLAEGDGYMDRLEAVALQAQTSGGAIHDARIAAICLHHGVAELLSADRDFSRFPALRTRNPLAA